MLSLFEENPGLRKDQVRKPKRAPFDINKVPKIEWTEDRPKPVSLKATEIHLTMDTFVNH